MGATHLLPRDDLSRTGDAIVDLVLKLPFESTLVFGTLECVDSVRLDRKIALAREEVLGIVVRERQSAEDWGLVEHLRRHKEESSAGRSMSQARKYSLELTAWWNAHDWRFFIPNSKKPVAAAISVELRFVARDPDPKEVERAR